MKKVWPPQDQVFWYLDRKSVMPCHENISADIAIIGGGMAGLSAAQAFSTRGKKVVLLEQYYCGSGATGKSSGFVTPNAELSFTDFSQKYTPKGAHTIWDFITSGVNDIRTNIEKNNFSCDYSPQDTLVLATSKKALKQLEIESDNLSQFGYKTAICNAQEVQQYIGSNKYFGGFTYEDTFGFDGYAYCQELKKHLQSKNVLIFEETPVTQIEQNKLITAHAQIAADYIIVCADRFTPQLGLLKQDIYHAQTFLMVSQQLTPEQIANIFPNKKHLSWDTELIYNYFRVTAQDRLLLGGGSVLNTYASKPTHDSSYMLNKLTKYFFNKFPNLDIQFEQMWPGLIGLSKDIVPIAGPDKDNPHMYYIAAAAGLPIAAALGRYSAENLLDGNNSLDNYFSPYRKFPIGGIVQSVLGNKISFALSNVIKMNIP